MTESQAHTAVAQSSDDEWVVTRNGTEIARSRSVMLVNESYGGRELDPVPYFPAADVVVRLNGPSEHTTFCPVKGEASYFAVDGDEETADGIWSYADPISPLEAVAGYVAFYSDRFKVTQTSQ